MTIRILVAAMTCATACMPRVDLGRSASFTRIAPATAARQVAVDESHLYWLSWDVPPPPGWQGSETSLLELTRADKDGSHATVLARRGFSLDDVFDSFALSVDGTDAWFSDQTFIDVEAASGGAPTELFASGMPSDTATVGGVALDATDVYWTSGHAVLKMPKTGGLAVALAANQDSPGHIAVDATTVYWVDDATAELISVAKSGGTPVTLATVASGSTLVVDDTDVYFDGDMTVSKVAKTGGPTTVVASDVLVIGGLAADATDVYFARDFTNIARVSKRDLSMSTVYDGGGTIDIIALDDASLFWSFDDGTIGTQPK
jgi:hypothetical protein